MTIFYRLFRFSLKKSKLQSILNLIVKNIMRYKNIKELRSRIVNLGRYKGMSRSEKVQLNIINLQGYIFIFFSFLLLLKSIILGYNDVAAVFIAMLLCIVVPILTYTKNLNKAKIYWTVLFPIIIWVLIVAYGDKPRGEILFLIPISNTLLLFKKRRHKVIIVIYITLLFIIGTVHNSLYTSILSGDTDDSDKFFTFMVALLCISTIIIVFVTELEGRLALLEQKNKALNFANQDIERITFMASHNLRTPVRVTLNYISMIKRNLSRGDTDNIEKDLGYIQQASKEMNNLISDMLDYSSVVKEQSQQIEVIDMEELVAEIVKTVSLAYEKEVNYQLNAAKNIQTHRVYLNAVLQNLIENGVKYNKSEVPKLVIDFQKQKNGYLLRVQDNGIGIEEVYHKKIFKMFERLHHVEEYEGTGIGLAMCKRILQKLDGRIWLESELGKGTTFYVEFPLGASVR